MKMAADWPAPLATAGVGRGFAAIGRAPPPRRGEGLGGGNRPAGADAVSATPKAPAPAHPYRDHPRALPDKIPMAQRQLRFVEIYEPQQQTHAASQAGRCIDCANPYCQWKCPVHNHIPAWLQMLRENRMDEAVSLCHETNSLPEVCGRICPHDRLCEGACTLNDGLGAVTIGAAEQFIADTALERGWRPDLSHVIQTDRRVAIVGAGPAGLACADVLLRHGVKPILYDRHPEIGGLLSFGIPSFKLEKHVMVRRRQFFEELGAEFHLDTEVGIDIDIAALRADSDALFLGMGTYTAMRGGFPGEELPGVHPALPYLIGNNRREFGAPSDSFPQIPVAGQRVVVLGGGDTAMDCNRSALRQQARSVHCVYRRDEDNMPGSRREVENSREEGVVFLFNRQPLEILGTGRVEGVRLARTHMQQETDESERQLPVTEPGNAELLEADIVLLAFGFRPSPPDWLEPLGVSLDSRGRVITEAGQGHAYQTSCQGVFAGGDMVRGSDLVVTAIWEGRQAALGMLRRFGIEH